MYFETKTKTKKEGKIVSDQFIMKAVCFTDAETTTTMNFGENEEFKITHIKESKIFDIINQDKKSFWEVTFEFISVDEGTGKEKKVREPYLFGADSLEEVKELVDIWLVTSIVPTKVVKLIETKIGEVIA